MSDLFDRAPGQRYYGKPAPADAAISDWGPASPPGAPGGQGTPPRKTPERYRATSWWLPAVVGLVVVGVVAALLWFGTRTTGSSTPTSPPPPTVAEPSRTPPPGGQGIEVESRGVVGYWEILSYAWDESGVTIDARISVDEGTLRFSWVALDNVSAWQYGASPSSTLYSGTVAAGDQVSGTVRFDKNQGDTLVILADSRGIQITALTIPG